MENSFEKHYVVNDDIKKSLCEARELKRKLNRIAADYLINHETSDFIYRINQLNLKENREQIPKVLMSISFDRKRTEREKVAELIIEMAIEKLITEKDLSKGFTILLSQMSELLLDIPRIVEYMEYFVNRFIDSKVLKYGDSKNFLELLSIYSGKNPSTTVKKITTKIIGNYFVSGEVKECVREIEEINDQSVYPLVVKYSVSLALDRDSQERELLSKLFSHVSDDMTNSKFIKQKSLSAGFIILLNCIEDLYEDVPDVYQYLSFFIARAIIDDCLPPIFLKQSLEKITGDAHIVINNVRKLLDMENSAEELQKIWDCNIENIDQIKLIVLRNVQAFFETGRDIEKLQKFILKMGHPNFHYQVVFQLFSTLLDRERYLVKNIGELVVSLVNRGVTSQQQVDKGFEKIGKRLSDLKIDVPDAEEVYVEFKRHVYKDRE